MKRIISAFVLILFLLVLSSLALAREVAPRISDREIVERLSRFEEGQNTLNKRFDDLRSEMNSRFDDLRSEMNSRFDAVDKRFDAVDKRFNAADKRFEAVDKQLDYRFAAVDKRFDAMDKRFDMLTWIIGLFITISLVILGFVVRMQWQMQQRQTEVETTLTLQRDELTFLKDLIEKLLPPKGVL